MKEDLERAIRDVAPQDWEQLCSDILRKDNYNVNPTTPGPAPDGGKDSLVSRGGLNGIAHYTTIEKDRVARKLRRDAKKAAGHDRDYDFFVFMTNQDVGGSTVDRLAEDIRDEYGWELRFWHRERVRNFLMGTAPEFAAEHLKYDPRAVLSDGKSKIDDYHQERIERIADRRDVDMPLIDGPAVALHLLPNGHDTVRYVDTPTDLPSPPMYGKGVAAPSRYPVGDALYSLSYRIGFMGEKNRYKEYSRLDEHGRFEAASTSPFLIVHDPNDVTLSGSHLEVDLVRTTKGALQTLDTLGVTPPIYLYISLLGVKGIEIRSSDGGGPLGSGGFATDAYTPPAVEISEFDVEVPELLREPINRTWTKGKWSRGSPYYSLDGWSQPRGI